ncbi:MAG: putative ATP-binding protein involved in virulence [Phenylobacterium sp.]|jgi:predicted ATP-binding protein involved in virulence
MKIHQLKLTNFRKFSSAMYQFNTVSGVTVLIGNNATGKSTILDALSIMMGSYLLDFNVGPLRSIRKSEMHLAQITVDEVITLEPQWPEGVTLSCIGSLTDLDANFNGPISWARGLKSETGNTTRSYAKNIASAGKVAMAKMAKGEEVLLPVLAYYGTGRLWSKKHNGDLGKPDSRARGYRDCLDPASNHHLFVKWFIRLSFGAVQKGKPYGVLEAVRQAVKQCIPECRDFYADLELQQLMVVLENTELLAFDNLSDGYRNMVAMVADIAYRAACLNPHLGINAALKTPGVVLIDEIDLHLHPKWQRTIMHSLRTAFPEVQFIVSTHSPFIVQSLEPGEVLDLNSTLVVEQGCEVASPAPDKPFCDRSIEDVVEDVMGVSIPSRSHRLREMYETATTYYTLLDTVDDSTEQEIEQLKHKLDALSAPFSENVAYHAFLEMKRMKAGL